MKKFCSSLLFALVLPLASAHAAAEVVLDRIVAVVNDDAILQSDLDLYIKLVNFDVALNREHQQRENPGRPLQPMPPAEVIRNEALRRLIDNHLILQAGGVNYLRISDEEIDQYLDRVVKTLPEAAGLDRLQGRKALQARLARMGIGYDAYRRETETQITTQQVAGQLLSSLVSVSQQEVDDFIASQVSQGNLKMEYNVSLIFISLGNATDPKAIDARRQVAEGLRQQLQQGADFAQLAKQYSNHASASNGGNLGWRSSSSLPEVLSNALVGMHPKEVSEVLQAGDGFYLVQLHDSRNNQNLSREQVENNLLNRKYQEQYNLLLLRLRNEAHIDIRI